MRVASGDRLANVVFAVCCAGLAGVGALRYWPSAPAPHAREHVIAEGRPDPLDGSLPVRDGAVLYVFVSSTCPVCNASLPFYRQLEQAAARTGVSDRVVFVSLEPEPATVAYLERGGIVAARVRSIVHPPDVPGTPTIVAVGADGRVRRSWAGRLSPQQERDVLAVVPAMGAAAGRNSVQALLARARAHLHGSRDIDSVTSLEVDGTETLMRDVGTRVQPYVFILRPPNTLHMRTGPLLHVLDAGRYSRRLVDTDRYGGPVLDRLIADPESVRVAAQGMQSHLMRLSLTYLCRVATADIVEDEGPRDLGSIKGRGILFRNGAARLQVELVVDSATSRPLAVVTPVHTDGGPRNGADEAWISILDDYRDVGGVRIPFRIDEWIGTSHSRVVLTSVRVDGR